MGRRRLFSQKVEHWERVAKNSWWARIVHKFFFFYFLTYSEYITYIHILLNIEQIIVIVKYRCRVLAKISVPNIGLKLYISIILVDVWTQSMTCTSSSLLEVQRALNRGNVEDGATDLSALSFRSCLATFLNIIQEYIKNITFSIPIPSCVRLAHRMYATDNHEHRSENCKVVK